MSWLNASSRPPQAVNWKINLAALWASQFISLSAFSFCLPFLPIYLKESGIVAADQAAHWSAVLLSVSAVSMMIFSPIWGSLGDRYGRKMMLVRANLAGGFVLYLMGLVDNIEALIVLRLLHGVFTGTVAAAQTLVATNTPDRKQGFAIGFIMAAVSAGQTAGNYFGGICAKYFGPVFSFKAGGVMLFLSTLLVIVAVRENFTRPEKLPAPSRSARMRRRRESINSFKGGLFLMAIIGFISVLQTYDGPILSLYVEHLFRATPAAVGLSESAVISEVYGIVGWVSALASIAAMTGSIAMGVVMDRRLPVWLWASIPAVCGLGALWVGLERTMFGLVFGRAVFLFFISGLASAVIVVLGRMTPNSKRGAAMGWSMTARSFGWSVAPLVGAHVAHWGGWGAAYVVLSGLCGVLVLGFVSLLRRYGQAFQPLAEEPSSLGPVGGSTVSDPGGHGRQV